MKLFKKKQLTPEELEEKSRREKEWADKCYRAGQRFGEKYNIAQKITRINEYANKYPKTFFLSLLALIVGCFVLNGVIVGMDFLGGGGVASDIQRVTLKKDRSRDVLNEEINSLYMQMDHYNKQLERFMDKESLTSRDSMEIGRLIIQMQELDMAIRGKEQAVCPTDSALWVDQATGKEARDEQD